MGLAWWEIISKPSPGGPTEGVSHGTATLSHVGLDPNQLHHCLLLRCVSSASTLDKMSLHHPAMIPGSPLRPSPLVLSMLLAPKMSRPSPGTPNVTSHHLQDCRSRPQTALVLCCCPFKGPHSIPVSKIQLTKWVFCFGRSPSFLLLI